MFYSGTSQCPFILLWEECVDLICMSPHCGLYTYEDILCNGVRPLTRIYQVIQALTCHCEKFQHQITNSLTSSLHQTDNMQASNFKKFHVLIWPRLASVILGIGNSWQCSGCVFWTIGSDKQESSEQQIRRRNIGCFLCIGRGLVYNKLLWLRQAKLQGLNIGCRAWGIGSWA